MAKRKKQTKRNNILPNVVRGMQTYGWIGMSLLVGVLAVSAITAREEANIEAIRPVVIPLIEGENLVTEEELLQVLSESFTKALDLLTLSDIDVERVEDILERQSFVADAEAYVDADLILTVSVTQRVPLLRVIADNEQNYYLDENGVRMPLSENYTVRVPVVTGSVLPWNDNFMSHPEHQLYQLVELTRYLREDDFLDALVEQIYVRENGEWVLAPKIGDQVIYLGHYDPQETPLRLERLKVFYREGLPYEGWSKYRSFDLRYADQVVAEKI